MSIWGRSRGRRVAISNQSYYRRRAEQELALARSARVKAAARAHYLLAAAYLERLDIEPLSDSDYAERERERLAA